MMRCSRKCQDKPPNLMSRTNALRTTQIIIAATTLTLGGCGFFVARELAGDEVAAPDDFSFIGEMSPCYLELQRGDRGLRVNCFHIAGELHIHSSRWAKLPRLGGENWTVTVRREPEVRVEIADKIYQLQAIPIEDEAYRRQLLQARGYWHPWDGITVYKFLPSNHHR